MQLSRGQRRISSIFDIHGTSENDMTDALGCVLARCESFASHLLRDLVGFEGDTSSALIRLQSADGIAGITDVRIVLPGKALVVIEAKCNSCLPTESQLRRYAPLLRAADAKRAALVCLTNATESFATTWLPPSVADVPVLHRTWRQLRDIALTARRHEELRGRYLLDEFIRYLEDLIQMETKYSNMVYVVSIGAGNPKGWSLSWKHIIEMPYRYFYPVGRGWPDPPNYLGFRYGGKLQRIHHVERFELFTNPRTIFPEAANEEWPQHYLFHLGPPIIPPFDVKNGPRIFRSGRVHCMLDTLLTSATISDALTETERRRNA